MVPTRIDEVLIVPGSARSGSRVNRRRAPDLGNPAHYPVTAVCAVCGCPVRREEMAEDEMDWLHVEPHPDPGRRTARDGGGGAPVG